jgi:hypothetical protein
MSWTTDLLGIVGGGGLTAALTYLGARRAAKQAEKAADRQADLDSRRVGIDEFEVFKKTYKEERAEDHKELLRLRGLLRTAIGHITSLRATMRGADVTPPPLPGDLVDFSLGEFETDG